MKRNTSIALCFATFISIFNPARAIVIGGEDMGWSIDFDKVTPVQKQQFGWSDSQLKTTGFRNFSNNYSVPGHEKWSVSGKAVAVHGGTPGPAFFSITEIASESDIEGVKKIHYSAMSDKKGFKEDKCTSAANGALLCDVSLDNWNPAKIFHAVFYEWKVGSRTFVLVVRNAQPSPDRESPEKAMAVLIALIAGK